VQVLPRNGRFYSAIAPEWDVPFAKSRSSAARHLAAELQSSAAMVPRHSSIHCAMLSVAALAVGCGGGGAGIETGRGPAKMRVVLTGAPPRSVASAWVKVSQVVLVSADRNVPVDLRGVSRSLFTYDLRWLDGVDVVLAEAAVPPGRFDGLLVQFSHADVTLRDGHQFTDGATVGRLEGPPRWIAVRLREPLDVRPGTMTVLRVDASACLREAIEAAPSPAPRRVAAPQRLAHEGTRSVTEVSIVSPLAQELREADREQIARL
jgi:hypothetical protein